MDEASVVKVTPAIELTVSFDREGGRSYGMRFAPLPLDVPKGELDEALDRVLAAVDRQQLKFELIDEQAKLASQAERIRSYERQSVRLEESARILWEQGGRRGEWDVSKMSPAHANAREQLHIKLDADRHDATARREKIDRLKERIHAADVSADHHAGVPDS